LFRADFRIRVRPLRASDRTQQNSVCSTASRNRLGGQGGIRGVDGGAADQMRFEFEFMAVSLCDCFQNAHGFGSHFGTDAIAT
jgi:hypothetical protein